MAYVGVKIQGLEPLLLELNRLAGPRTNQVIRRALSRASRPMLDAAKKNTALLGDYYWTGTLKASLGLKDKVYKNSTGAIVVIGARSNHKREAIERGSGRRVLRNPTKYMHLVEKGHRIARGGRLPRPGKQGEHPAVVKARNAGATGHSVGFVKGIPILEMAFNATQEQCVNLFQFYLNSWIYNKQNP